ncbi:MAG: type II toxin-antitoxin system RelE/ParE family toxin [Elusimicrobia bacterium]|nr:type II toxin-antitoxin system RelE/ParE family toxin [Elusimicrobiota bacterium]
MSAVVWSKRAVAHLRAIREYVRKFNPTAAESTAGRILEAVKAISDYPNIGEPDESGRRFAVSGTPYVIFYQVRDVVEIIAVLHGAQVFK